MATGNPFLGTARKSIGDVTLYRSRGQQRARVRVREIANPRSFLQLLQRSVLANVSHLYSVGQSIFNHSFQGVAPGTDTQTAFMRVNTNLLRSLLAADYNGSEDEESSRARIGARGIKAAVPFGGLIVSQGNYTQEQFDYDPESYLFHLRDFGDERSVKEYAAAANLVPGDIFTFLGFAVGSDTLANFNGGDYTDKYANLYGSFVEYIQLKVKDGVLEDDTTITSASPLTLFFDIKASDPWGVTRVSALTIGTLAIDAGVIHGAGGNGGIACIRSRYDSDLRSNSQLMPSSATPWQYGLTYHFLVPAWGNGSPIDMPTRILTGVNFM